MPVLAITFDADQTLWDFRAVQKLALRATADEMMRAGDVSSVTPSDLTRAREETVLGRLKLRYKLGLVSNGNTYPDRCGLPATFDATADYQISNLDGLEAILEAIGGPRQRSRVR